MKFHWYLSLILFAALITLGCNQRTSDPISSLKEQVNAHTKSLVMPGMIGDRNNQNSKAPRCLILPQLPDWHSAYFVIEHVSIQDDIITFVVSYPGGCKRHNFQLVSTTFQESDTARVFAKVFHNNNNDPCDLCITEELNFDLSPLKALYLSTYDNSCGEIIIDLINIGASDLTLIYSFCEGNVPEGPPLPKAYLPTVNSTK